MLIILLLYVITAQVANSQINNQTESTTRAINTSIPLNENNNNSLLAEVNTRRQNDGTDKPSLQLSNTEVKISFSENATELISQLRLAIEKLVASLSSSKINLEDSKPRRRNFDSSILDIFPKFLRNKREADNETDVSSNPTLHVLNDIQTTAATEITTEAPDNNITIIVNNITIVANNITEATTEVTNKIEEIDNYEDYTPDWLNNNATTTSQEANITNVNGRRSFNSDMEIAKVIRTRLLSYVHEHINDTMFKISSLQNIKNSFGKDNSFNIGYIMANVDLIDVNLRKLNESIDKKHQEWAEAHILDIFDKVKFTNQVVTSLMAALKSIFNSIPQPRINPVYSNVL